MSDTSDSSPNDKGKKRKSSGDAGPSTSKGNFQDEDIYKKSKTNEGVSEEDNMLSKYIENVTIETKSAFDGRISTYKFTVESSDSNKSNVDMFLKSIKQQVCQILMEAIHKETNTRAVFDLKLAFVDNEYSVFDIKYTIFLRNDNEDEIDVDSYFQSASNEILTKYKKETTSTDIDSKLICLNLHIHETNIGYGRSNISKLWKNNISNYIIEFITTDQMSFKWAVLAGLHEDELRYNRDVEILRKYSNELVLEGIIDYPVKLHDLPRIEELNNMSFNVFVLKYNGTSDELQGPVRHTEQRRKKHINLLLRHEENTYHYCYIKDLAGLVDSNKSGQIICDGCLCFFENTQVLLQHQTFDCLRVKTLLSSNVEKFVQDEKNKTLPIVVYADFEALLEPVENSSSRESNETFKINVNRHVPYSFAFYIKCHVDESLSRLRYFSFNNQEQCESSFVEKLKFDLEEIFTELEIKPTDKWNYIPVYFHNLSNYDGHFIIKGIYSVEGKVDILGNENTYIAIHKKIKVNNCETTLRILDSYKFLVGSLDSLAVLLNRNQCVESREYWGDIDDETFTLLTQKGIFPYDYITSFADLEKTLPEKIHFYNSLKKQHVTNDEYSRALKVWEKFNCKNMLDYAMIYLRVDVLLLADLFENLRQICLDAYQIDPARYYTMAAVSWDIMLKVTGMELQMLPEIDMLLFLKKANRGGISHCTKRYAVANNKYLPSTYEESQNSSYLLYYDANNLYGWAMSQPLPYGGFEWLTGDDVNVIFDVPEDSKYGYFLEVDLEYPYDKNVHDEHADYPFCPEHKSVDGVSGKRLISDLTSKNKYILHHSNLKQCLSNGLRLLKIHRVLKFNQKRWLKPFVDSITQQRTNASTDIERDFYKRMINSVYGKSIQNIEQYGKVQIFNNWDWGGNRFKPDVHFTIEKPECDSYCITSDDLVKVALKNTKHNYKSPTYIGYAVQELSKFHMYDFHYGFMKKKFGKNIKLLYTDTDSFLYQIFTEDYYDDIRTNLKDHFDTSDYPVDNRFNYELVNKKRVGYFKDEFKESIVEEFVALRPKVYIIVAGNETKKAAASAPLIIKEQLTVEDYKDCLFKKTTLVREFHQINADGDDLFTKHVRKAVLGYSIDTKRHCLENGIDSLPKW